MADVARLSGRLRDGGRHQHGLPPAIDAQTRLLVLGSFPSEASLAAAQYYAHPRNHFWPLLAAVLELPLPALPYTRRLAALRRYRVGLWDVIVRCKRAGSSDGEIRDATHGEIEIARRRAPRLAVVCFNGQTAARAAGDWEAAGYGVRALPSSSPAYTLPFADKLAAWRVIGNLLRDLQSNDDTAKRRRG